MTLRTNAYILNSHIIQIGYIILLLSKLSTPWTISMPILQRGVQILSCYMSLPQPPQKRGLKTSEESTGEWTKISTWFICSVLQYRDWWSWYTHWLQYIRLAYVEEYSIHICTLRMGVLVKQFCLRVWHRQTSLRSTEWALDNRLNVSCSIRSHVNIKYIIHLSIHGLCTHALSGTNGVVQASNSPSHLRGPTTTREWSRWFVMSACWPSLTTLKGMVRWSPRQTEEERGTREFPMTHKLCAK